MATDPTITISISVTSPSSPTICPISALSAQVYDPVPDTTHEGMDTMNRYSDPTITIEIPSHGTFSVSAQRLDQAISQYLPASVSKLRRLVQDATGIDYSDVLDVSALLIVLADVAVRAEARS